MNKKQPLADDDGNIIPAPEVGSDVAAIIYLLEYGRRRGFQIGPTVQVNDTTVQVRDLRQAADDQPKAAPETSIWEENGHRE